MEEFREKISDPNVDFAVSQTKINLTKDSIKTKKKSFLLSKKLISNLTIFTDTAVDNLETMTGSMAKLIKNMATATNGTGDAAKAFEKLGVKMIMDPTKIGHHRKITDNEKIYSLWDAYAQADFVTYPSIYEGWGNQFLEGLFAKKPMLVYEYSVFEEDIKPNGFYYATLGNKYSSKEDSFVSVDDSVIDNAVSQIIKYLFDSEERSRCVEQNFLKGKLHYSTKALRNLLEPLFK